MTTILHVTNDKCEPRIDEVFPQNENYFLFDNSADCAEAVSKLKAWRSELGLCSTASPSTPHWAIEHVCWSVNDVNKELPEIMRPEFTVTETFMYSFVPVLHGCYGSCIIIASSLEEASRSLKEHDGGYDNTEYKLLAEYPNDDRTMAWREQNLHSFYLISAVRLAGWMKHKVVWLSFGSL